MSNSDPVRGAQLINKACNLLQLFNSQQIDISIAEIAAQAQLNPSTAYRIVQALVRQGILIQDPETGKYRLGYQLIKLGELAKLSNDLIRIAAPHVESLAKIWGETTILDSMIRDFEVVSIFAIPSSYRLGISVNHNNPLPAHCLASGKLLLASLPQQQLNEYLQHNFARFTPQTITDASLLQKSLENVRQTGYATSLGEHEVGFNAVGAPVRNSSGNVIAALSVGGPSSRLTPALLPSVIESVVQTAYAISSDMGYTINMPSSI